MKVIIAGDFAPRARLSKQIKSRRYGDVFPEKIRRIIKSADFAFVNFESPIAEIDYKPITKCGPNLRCSPEAAEAVKFAGFSCVTLANNHILDYGVEGLKQTVNCCSQQDLDVVGVGDNLTDAESVLYLKKGGKTLAVINCCEHEFSIATAKEAGANPLNPVHQFYSIQKAKKKADYVLVIVHGGHEHYQYPSIRMQETYRFLIDAGADAVVNHHQHCYSGYEIYNEKPIFYGLGNFCFDIAPIQDETPWNYGYMLQLEFGEKIEYDIYPYKQYGKEGTILLLSKTEFDATLRVLNAIIADSCLLKKKTEEYYQKSVEFENYIMEPYSGRVVSKLFDMGLLPSLISDEKRASIFNHVVCESHRDKLIFALKERII